MSTPINSTNPTYYESPQQMKQAAKRGLLTFDVPGILDIVNFFQSVVSKGTHAIPPAVVKSLITPGVFDIAGSGGWASIKIPAGMQIRVVLTDSLIVQFYAPAPELLVSKVPIGSITRIVRSGDYLRVEIKGSPDVTLRMV